MSPLEGCWRGSSPHPLLLFLGWVVCSLPTHGVTAVPEDSRWPWPPAPGGGPAVHACPMHSDLWGAGGWVASTVLCLQLVQKVKVSDASIQEVLEPLNLDFSSPLEKVGATLTPRPSPPQRPTQPRKYWKGKGRLCSQPLLQDLTPGQERWPSLRDAGLGALAPLCVPPLHKGPSRPGSALPAPPRPALLQRGRHSVVLVPSSHASWCSTR